MTRWTLTFWLLLASSVQAQTSKGPSKPTTPAEAWEIDTERSKLAFDVRLFLGRSQGRFDSWSGLLTVPPDDWTKATVDVVIQASSINTNNSDRDEHLRNADFFDVEKYPEITFKSTSVKRAGDSITVAGHLTMKGVTKPVMLAGKFLGTTPGERPRMSFHASTVINRRDYGVSYNRVREGGPMLGDDVTVTMTISAVRKPAVP